MSTKNVILKDKDGNQLAPATTADQVRYDENTNMKQVISPLQSYVTPERFGAKGDGISDDYSALQNAIDYATVNHLTLVCGNQKIYNTSKTILIEAPVSIIGNNAVIARISNVHDILVIQKTNNVHIKELIINGRSSEDELDITQDTDWFNGIMFDDCENCQLESVEVFNTTNAEIQDGAAKGAILIYDSSGIDIINSYVHDITGSGIFYYGTSNHCKVIGGKGENLIGSAISGGCDDLCVICFTSLNAGYSGISLNGERNICDGCYSYDSGYSGINIGHNSSDGVSSIVSNCEIKNSGLDGITIASDNVSVSNCKISDSSRNGIRVHISGDNTKLSNIDVENCTYSALMFDQGDISANLIYAKSDSILTLNSGVLKISESTFEHTNSSANFIGGSVAGGTVEFINCVMRSLASLTGRFLHQSAGTIEIKDCEFENYGYYVYQTAAGGVVNYRNKDRIKKITSTDGSAYVDIRITNGMIMFSKYIGGGQSYSIPIEEEDRPDAQYTTVNGSCTAKYNSSTHTIDLSNSGSSVGTCNFIGAINILSKFRLL